MSRTHGFGGALEVSGATAVGELQGWNLDEQATVTESYAMGDEYADNEATVKKWSGSAECYFDEADAGQLSLGVGDVVALSLYPDGKSSGKHIRSGDAVITGAPISASKDGYVSITFNFSGKGALSKGTVD